ncbi:MULTISPECIES: carbohydrate ABC transporter permease [unclassified Oceanispirochaeta]|uniref:carbohydrate ABC transporter permease n=1 Tax=unclassified Oceanispirochaeta TaxID=2635722 RepID=UPI000E0903F7|nr:MULTISPECIES: carbohydrate ABC transporter permease [unclassified Oceanispirochaeta]MBF9018640.1 carbohydrate ABC transporter permease [Oceanispirochaeta sp. M2]NPD75077.1 carbohydrate ABC transporter permease [Oceanispirochaeta sp. M1]RDG29064.1 carbohydrate ABC transporter permease [Oceanispirochaeta sp. M1]
MNKALTKSHKSAIIVLSIGAVVMVFPFIWMILSSLKSYGEAISIPLTIIPNVWRFDNYLKAMKLLPFSYLYFNTAMMILGRCLFAYFLCSMAGYSFARIKYPGRNFLFSLVLIQMMVPSQVFIIPQYLMVLKLNWINTIPALIFPGFVSAFGTFLLRQFYMTAPSSLEEAAIIDGANRWKIYWHIMLPLAKNSLMALSIFTALFAWKDLMWPIIVNTSIGKLTLSAGLANLQGQYDTNIPVVLAGSVIATLPMIVIFLSFQQHFVQGIAFTGTKE